ncbi:thioesterase family protein, partial [Chamaesiphon sp. OTE_8_metabat_110]
MSFQYEYTIQFRDTDAAGVVYFSNIISICHVGYEAALIKSGIDLKLFVNNSDFAVPITHVSADFLKPLYCGDRVIIELTPQSIDSFRFEIKYRILTEASQVAATAITKHVTIDPTTRKRIELPVLLTNWIEQW